MKKCHKIRLGLLVMLACYGAIGYAFTMTCARGYVVRWRIARLHAALKEKNPEWCGYVHFVGVEPNGWAIIHIELGSYGLKDISPLRGEPLRVLNLDGADELKDLSPLKGMPLEYLSLRCCHDIRNLAPLKGMPLRYLLVESVSVTDVSPVKDCPLEVFLFYSFLINDETFPEWVRALYKPEYNFIYPLSEDYTSYVNDELCK